MGYRGSKIINNLKSKKINNIICVVAFFGDFSSVIPHQLTG